MRKGRPSPLTASEDPPVPIGDTRVGRRKCPLRCQVARICRSPRDYEVPYARKETSLELKCVPRRVGVGSPVNWAPRRLGVGVRVPPSLEGGCGADKGVYLSLETLPQSGSRAGCHPSGLHLWFQGHCRARQTWPMAESPPAPPWAKSTRSTRRSGRAGGCGGVLDPPSVKGR